ncbi:HDR059Wp [Eremothecium sinecaudum]|uniref:HDR059Wp n=1 Tax=Eremothecium sinecaudum TaxID=45286 RepID=A0A0X8HS18_9SACH|nr:HDR059Wp [Eremothecium sinecaudum]AMD20801.1 HDR059Wp [Eremothecium sinecaudum]
MGRCLKLTTIFKMKRPHTDYVGISSYKRQRLVSDLENLSLNDEPLQGVGAKRYSSGLELCCERQIDYEVLPDCLKEQIVGLVRGDGEEDKTLIQTRVLRMVWEDVYQKGMQVVKWVNWKEYMYKSWLSWYQRWTYMLETLEDVDMENYDSDVVMEDVDMEG